MEVQHNSNLADISVVDRAATEVDCKMLTEKSVASAFGDVNTTIGRQDCKAANEAALQHAYSLVPKETLARHQREGKPFLIEDDVVYHTGISWQAGSFQFASDKTHVKVRSPLLNDGSDLLCKLVAPSRVVEYMMVDGLPRFDGTVP